MYMYFIKKKEPLDIKSIGPNVASGISMWSRNCNRSLSPIEKMKDLAQASRLLPARYIRDRANLVAHFPSHLERQRADLLFCCKRDK